MKTLIIGYGYLGSRVAGLLREQGDTVFGTTRSLERARSLEGKGIVPVLADVLQPETLTAFPQVDRMLYAVGFDRSSGRTMREVYVEGLRNVLDHHERWSGRWVYASSTGVYGQSQGEWVDEDSPTEPSSVSGQVCLDAEQLALSTQGSAATILRFSGLYGPGRLLRKGSLLGGEPIVGNPNAYLNLIHVDDAALASIRALDHGKPGRLYLVSDDRPVPRREFYELLAHELGAPRPRFVPLSPESHGTGRDTSNRRVCNQRIKSELGVFPRFPDITTGVPSAVAAEWGRG